MKIYPKLSAMYYDVSKPVGVSLGGDLEFYYKKIKQAGSILEAGAGTGRLLIPYLEKGLPIQGIDVSPEMVELCKQNCIQHDVMSKVELGDVCDMVNHGLYDVIMVPTGTFCLFSKIDAVLENFYDHLEPEGMLIFDLIYPHGFVPGSHHRSTVYPDKDHTLFLEDHHEDINWQTQTTRQFLTYELWHNTKLISKELQVFDVHWYQTESMIQKIKQTGFSRVELFGDYGETFNPEDNHEVVTVCAYK
ncbi:class I SAM-dependent DNA methyltransferase [Erysipelothrix tonsillarum]|uniref:class I SAM-dependent DNA methyltransferase n=1 Tax=Erysipelothrix tonsillarum TaxID=38402 RepID=UPI0003616201|nr:class I SAM-dependent methyltransferase [Erysipelothrix tonsillarum]